jgi:hypothetical protein
LGKENLQHEATKKKSRAQREIHCICVFVRFKCALCLSVEFFFAAWLRNNITSKVFVSASSRTQFLARKSSNTKTPRKNQGHKERFIVFVSSRALNALCALVLSVFFCSMAAL